MTANNNAAALKEIPTFSQNSDGIKIGFPSSIVPDSDKVSFSLYRTDDKNLDVIKDLQLSSEKDFLIPSKVLVKGSYTLKVKWSEASKPYQVDYDVLWK